MTLGFQFLREEALLILEEFGQAAEDECAQWRRKYSTQRQYLDTLEERSLECSWVRLNIKRICEHITDTSMVRLLAIRASDDAGLALDAAALQGVLVKFFAGFDAGWEPSMRWVQNMSRRVFHLNENLNALIDEKENH